MILTTALLDKEMHKPIIRMCETNPGQEKNSHRHPNSDYQ